MYPQEPDTRLFAIIPICFDPFNMAYHVIGENTTREQQARGYMSHDNNTFTASVDSGYLALRTTAYSSWLSPNGAFI